MDKSETSKKDDAMCNLSVEVCKSDRLDPHQHNLMRLKKKESLHRFNICRQQGAHEGILSLNVVPINKII